MRRAIVPLALVAAGGVIAVGFAAFGKPISATSSENGAASIATVSAQTPPDTAMIARWADAAPFRRSRTPSGVAYDARRLAAVEQVGAIVRPKPLLQLRGLVGGSQPAAIVEGLPGTEGPKVVRVGERIDEMTVRSIANGRVVIRGMDTTWTLVLPRSAP